MPAVAPDDVEAGAPAASGMRERATAGAEQVAERGRERAIEQVEGMEGGEEIGAILGGDNFVLRALLILVPCQYIAWYGAVVGLSLAFGVSGDDFLINFIEPFDHENLSPLIVDGDRRPLVIWLSCVLTLTLANPWLIFIVCRHDSSRAVEIATPMQALHFFLCTTVTQATPENWVWWATVMPCSQFMGRMAAFMINHIRTRKRPRRRGAPTTPYTKSRG